MGVKSILSQKSRDVISCKREDLVIDCVKMMNQNKIGALVVLSYSNKIDGIITERDVLRAIDERNGNIGQALVSEVMTSAQKMTIANSNEPIEKIMDLMTNNRIRHIPIVENDNIIGLVSIGDVVKSLLDKALVENESMKNYISGN